MALSNLAGLGSPKLKALQVRRNGNVTCLSQARSSTLESEGIDTDHLVSWLADRREIKSPGSHIQNFPSHEIKRLQKKHIWNYERNTFMWSECLEEGFFCCLFCVGLFVVILFFFFF